MRIRRRFFDAQSEQESVHIDMVPMIDTIFLILTVLLYGMLNMTVHRGIKVHLPGAVAADPDRADRLTLTITESGEIFMNKERVSKNELPGRLQSHRASFPAAREVYLFVDRAARYDTVIAVMDACRQAGLAKISLETASPSTP
ncbi:biopolymer transporter ExbD [bacterium]|nr:biopolymer transporter ExbD [bacterium]